MLINSRQLLNLPVYTEDGRHLGQVFAFDLDIETQAVRNYQIKTSIIKGLWQKSLIISPAQVVSISAEKMVVKDSVLAKTEPEVVEVKLAGLAQE